ncbi:MAG TPA: non-canonical purine NTP pyrophosphatase [Chloroflexota bacterium]
MVGQPFILLGTTNQAKRRELSALLSDAPIRLLTLADLGPPPEVVEDGATLDQNALLKARAFARWSGLPTIADDGGLEIDALGGEPGVRSRRWIEGREASDEELIAHTLERLRGVPPERRGASMRVVVAFALPPVGAPIHPAARALGATPALVARLAGGPAEVVGEGRVVGTIPLAPWPGRDPGFPYRSVFFVPELGKFYGQLTPAEHERINHRRAALAPIRARLAARP